MTIEGVTLRFHMINSVCCEQGEEGELRYYLTIEENSFRMRNCWTGEEDGIALMVGAGRCS